MTGTEPEEIREIHQQLLERYGEPEEPKEMTGIEYLIETILSQNTNDINRDKAFRNLKERYGNDWQEVVEASQDELADTIRVAGLGPTKAERIQRALEIAEETRGEYSIEFLKDTDTEKAESWLTDIPGIGPKTAAVILLFHFRKPKMPVDTHVHRIAQRFELVPEGCSRGKSHEILEDVVPDGIKYSFHKLLIAHGRETCKARNHLDNEDCFERCIYYREVVLGEKKPDEVV